jgi:hypothetical protein
MKQVDVDVRIWKEAVIAYEKVGLPTGIYVGKATWNYEELRARLQVTRQIKSHTPEHKSEMLLDHSGQLQLGEINTDGAMTFKLNHRKRGWGDLNSVGKIW